MSLHLHVPLIGGVLFLGACSTPPAAPLPPPEPVVRTVTVISPIAVPCVTALPPEPTYADAPGALAKAATPDFAGIWNSIALMRGGRAQRDSYIAQLQATLTACIGMPK